MINKIVGSFDEAVADMADGATVLIGSFGGPAECPGYLIAAVARKEVKNLTIVGNTGGWGVDLLAILRERMAVILKIAEDWYDPGLLVQRGQVKKGILCFPAAPARVLTPFEQGVLQGQVELELLGQGTLCERMRAGRGGIPAFYTPVGVGTIVEEGKEVREFNGRKHLLEYAIKGDFSLIRAHKADRYGNLVYRGTARTFNRHCGRGGRGGGAGRAGPRVHRHAWRVCAAGGGAAQGDQALG
jgi:acyl CoA:acetate/3-ketoacid CoA transferase alpha subunit